MIERCERSYHNDCTRELQKSYVLWLKKIWSKFNVFENYVRLQEHKVKSQCMIGNACLITR